MTAPVIVVLSPSALPLARRIRGPLFAEIHGPEGLEGCNQFYAKAKNHIASLFVAGRAVIGICASGILIRAVASATKDKLNEPPVIAVSEDGGAVVPLLGGHHGANDLARRIAALTSGFAAITTASDVMLGTSLDDVSEGYVQRHVCWPVSGLSQVKVMHRGLNSFTRRMEPSALPSLRAQQSPERSRTIQSRSRLALGVNAEHQLTK
jgi:hypothetical protein